MVESCRAYQKYCGPDNRPLAVLGELPPLNWIAYHQESSGFDSNTALNTYQASFFIRQMLSHEHRAPPKNQLKSTQTLVQPLVAYLPANADRLECYRQAQKADAICSKLQQYRTSGWPSKHQVKGELALYWKVMGELTLCDDLLCCSTRIVVPQSQRAETLHQGHQGIQKCLQRVSTAVWWPGISHEIEKLMKSCPSCLSEDHYSNPDYPRERVASDMFETVYLLRVDYFSRYIEVQKHFSQLRHCNESCICTLWDPSHTCE